MSGKTNLNCWPELRLSRSLCMALGVPGWVCDGPTEEVEHFLHFSVKCECVCNPALLSKNNLVSPVKVNTERITEMATRGRWIIWDFHLLLVGPPCPSRNHFWLLTTCQRVRPGPAYVTLKMHRLFPRGRMWFASQRSSAVLGSPRGKSGLSCLGSHRNQSVGLGRWTEHTWQVLVLTQELPFHPLLSQDLFFPWVIQTPKEACIMKMSLGFQSGQCRLPPAPQPSSPTPTKAKRLHTAWLNQILGQMRDFRSELRKQRCGTRGGRDCESSKCSYQRDYEKFFFFFNSSMYSLSNFYRSQCVSIKCAKLPKPVGHVKEGRLIKS